MRMDDFSSHKVQCVTLLLSVNKEMTFYYLLTWYSVRVRSASSIFTILMIVRLDGFYLVISVGGTA